MKKLNSKRKLMLGLLGTMGAAALITVPAVTLSSCGTTSQNVTLPTLINNEEARKEWAKLFKEGTNGNEDDMSEKNIVIDGNSIIITTTDNTKSKVSINLKETDLEKLDYSKMFNISNTIFVNEVALGGFPGNTNSNNWQDASGAWTLKNPLTTSDENFFSLGAEFVDNLGEDINGIVQGTLQIDIIVKLGPTKSK